MFKKKTFHISFEDEEHAFTSDVLIHEVVFSYSFKLDIKGELEWLSERDIDIIEEKYIYSDILPERFYPVVKECIKSFIILNKDEEETERLIAEYGELDIKDINVRNIINKLMNDITK